MKHLILLFLANLVVANAQTHKLDENEGWKKFQERGEFLPASICIWICSEFTGITTQREFEIYFPDDYYSKSVDNKLLIGFLSNKGKDTIKVAMEDSKVSAAKLYFLVDDKWIAKKENPIWSSTCGNSFFDMNLIPGHKIAFKIYANALMNGDKKTQAKVGLKLNEQEIFSNNIDVYLTENQLKKLKEEN